MHGDFNDVDFDYVEYFESISLEVFQAVGRYVNQRDIGGNSGAIIGANLFDKKQSRAEAIKYLILDNGIPSDRKLKKIKVSKIKNKSKDIIKAVKKWLSNGGIKPDEDATDDEIAAAKKKDVRAKKAISDLIAFISRKENVILNPALSMTEAKSARKNTEEAASEDGAEDSDDEFTPALEFYSGALVSDDKTDEFPPSYNANFLAVFDSDELELLILIQGDDNWED